MTPETVNLVIAVAAVAALAVIAISALFAGIAVWRVSRDVRSASRSLARVTDAINTELPPTLKELRATSTNLAHLSSELEPRLERVDALLDETDLTLQSLRATVESAEEIVRGPAAAVDRARRMALGVGEGLARGADRLLRGVQGRGR